ncbi:calcium-translocating P-type ATPase [Chaetomium strumarium]|uniref:Calcium-transporting ATPase 2 n=1 Tax=Chaetomium strumarium TaxID=1170767 RepID=A0AAJ0M241_9PEZI|nr:calcium-translocating P-type ATPase [Chaetomium strumarium]
MSADQLRRLNEARSIAALRALGGQAELAHAIRSDAKAGLSLDGDHSDRRKVYGENRLPKPKQRSLLQLAWLAFNDKLIFLLTASNVVSLALGIYEAVTDDGEGGDGGGKLEWIEGVTIAVAILVIVFGQAINDKLRNRRFLKLNEKKDERDVAVVRSGRNTVISVFDILVGDLVRLEAGDVVPADGVLVDGFGVQCDESPLSGESELVAKIPVREAVAEPVAEAGGHSDCFIMSGTRVVHGVGTYLVTAVGTNSVYGRIQMSLHNDVEETPLQRKLGRLAKYIIIAGFVVGSLFFTILLIRWLVRLRYFVGTPEDKGESFLDIFMLSVTVVVIGVPEGLSLAVAVALAFATTRMLKDNNLVRLLRSCETMGNATTICSDKTGTLTQNVMSVVSGVIGKPLGREKQQEPRVSPPVTDDKRQSEFEKEGPTPMVTGANLSGTTLSADVVELLKQSVALNSTAFEQGGPGTSDFIGSSTESALLKFGRDHLAMGPLAEERENAEVVELFPFNPVRKWMAALIKTGAGGKHRMLVKGAPEVILAKCSTVLSAPEEGLASEVLTEQIGSDLSSFAHELSGQMLRTVALAYQDFDVWPPATDTTADDDDGTLTSQTGVGVEAGRVDFEGLSQHLTLAGILAIRDPLRPEVPDSVRKCQDAGVFVRMVTGDAFETARAISQECGIYTAGGIAMDGPTFRKLTSQQLGLVLPRLQVLARSSPADKERLVRHLKRLGETVAVTGDGTNDAFALKAADVGFAMGVSGTEIAKEASSIILMDDNFASIVKALAWGRTVNNAAKKFIQFQFTINITAAILTIVSTLVDDVDASIFAVIQLLWLNLIMDIFAAAALATDSPTPDLLKRRPEPRNAQIIDATMWKMILGQSIYQLAVIFSLHYAGRGVFTASGADEGVRDVQHHTLVFNTYMMMQLFNQLNCRRTDNDLNILAGVHRNPWFIGVQLLTLAGQIVIIFKGGNAFQTAPLTGAQWGWCLLFGLLTLPLGAAIRQVPDSLVAALGRRLRPLAWPVRRAVRFFRGRREKSRRKNKSDLEQRIGDRAPYYFEDLEDDEERRVRRIQWTWHWQHAEKATTTTTNSTKKKKAPTGHGIASAMASAGADLANQTVAAVGLPQRLGRAATGFSQVTTTTAATATEDDNNDDLYTGAGRGEIIDLPAAIERAKRGGGADTAAGSWRLEVHPDTDRDDPVIMPDIIRARVPPSQNAALQRWMA